MSYYDLDDILADDVPIHCTTRFPFATLGHLTDNHNSQTNRKRKHDDDASSVTFSLASSNNTSTKRSNDFFLPERSMIQLPLWAVRRWGELNFVQMHIPKQFHKRVRERLVADPATADIRNGVQGGGQFYFTSGLLLCEHMERCVALNLNHKQRRMSMSAAMRASYGELQREAMELRRVLLELYTGPRLRKCLDWALSSVGQDVTSYTRTLTDCEMKLFRAGLDAAKARFEWKSWGSKKIPVSKIMSRWNSLQAVDDVQDDIDVDGENEEDGLGIMMMMNGAEQVDDDKEGRGGFSRMAVPQLVQQQS